MPVARPGASSAGNRSWKLLLVAAFAALCVTFAFAESPAPAQAAACGPIRVAIPPRAQAANRMPLSSEATTSVITARGAAEWLGARAGTALAEKTFLTGIEWVARMAGHRNASEQTLQQLGEIRGHLDQISGRIGRVENRLDHLVSTVHNRALDDALRPLCAIARSQRSLFVNYYDPLMKAGYKLARILRSTSAWRANEDDGSGLTPQERVEVLLPAFMEHAATLELEDPADAVHTALIPNGRGTSVLSAYGRVLLTQRSLSTADSKRLRSFYQQLADVRAVATWMSEEYWSNKRGFQHVVRARQKALVADNAKEKLNLPPMIPPGVVIDLGQGGSDRATGQPMWFPPAEQDLSWLPRTTVGQRFGSSISLTQVDDRMAQLNGRRDLGGSWVVPTRTQLTALLSNGCRADRADPNRYRDNVPCTNAVGPNTGGNVAGYLQGLNQTNHKWRQLFCHQGPCPQGAGPGGASSPRHAFVWTRNTHTENMFCGNNVSDRRPREWRRALPTYTGMRTNESRHAWNAFPQLLGRPPSAGRPGVREDVALNRCDSWVTKLIREAPARNIWTSGILLATRYANNHDLNQHNQIDYMAQR